MIFWAIFLLLLKLSIQLFKQFIQLSFLIGVFGDISGEFLGNFLILLNFLPGVVEEAAAAGRGGVVFVLPVPRGALVHVRAEFVLYCLAVV